MITVNQPSQPVTFRAKKNGSCNLPKAAISELSLLWILFAIMVISETLRGPRFKNKSLNFAQQKHTAVTAYLKSKQLLLFVFVC